MKSGLAGGIETGGWADVDKGAHFTADELKDIFTFRLVFFMFFMLNFYIV